MAQTATMERRDRPARMAMTATKALRAIQDLRATKAMQAQTELALPIKAWLSLLLSQQQRQRQVQQLPPPPPQVDRLGRKDLLDRLELQAQSLVLRARRV